jgi:hypothetical protein
MSDVRESIMTKVRNGEIDGVDPTKFALDSPKAVIKDVGGSGSSVGGNRGTEAPEDEIEDFRTIADTDPHVNEAIETLVDYLVGSGFSVQPANIPGTDEEQAPEDIAELKRLIETSTLETVLHEWVWHALVDGTGFLEIVVEDDVFKPKVLPTERMTIVTDEFGNVEEWQLEPPSGGGQQDAISFEPSDLAILRFHKHPGEDFGHSLLESCHEQADMLRDMEIDLARFVATKAYPPILWKLGSEDRPWTQDQIDGWLEELEEIDPESQLAVGHDVDHEVVGVTSTSSDQGAMQLDSTFEHLMRRIAAGLGVPAFLLNMGIDVGQGAAQVEMPKFDRRIQRYRAVIREAVRHQLFVSILAGDSDPAEYNEVPPEFEFGQHSSEEERLEADKAIKLLNNGLIKPEAAARKLDIDPEIELPEIWGESNFIEVLMQLAGNGDNIQNSDGGSPTDTGGGADSSGGEVKTREKPSEDNSGDDSRNKQDVTN